MAADIGQISQLLNATLDPTQHRKGFYLLAPRCPAILTSSLPLIYKPNITAEAALKQEAAKPQYSLALLNIVNSDSLPSNTRLAAALAFKNFIRTNYVVGPSQEVGPM
jgi:exportin-2 (importin alpha re-exporter)